MKTYRFTIRPLSAFGTPLVGDTLFGQLCWAIAYRFGENHLSDLLKGYDEQRPFMVVSDAFLQGYLPLPTLPSSLWKEDSEVVDPQKERKKLKKLTTLLQSNCTKPVNQWQLLAYQHQENQDKEAKGKSTKYVQLHNTIDRTTQTTGTGQFAPFTSSQALYSSETKFDLYIVLDEERFSLASLKLVLQDVGQFGFGRDASTGLGKFSLDEEVQAVDFVQNSANAYLTLANCAPQNLSLNKAHSFYQIIIRFGRHGGKLALHASPFKNPIILAKTGAIFTPDTWQDRLFLGNGLTQISVSQPEAVHQGYAPVVCVNINFSQLEQGENNE